MTRLIIATDPPNVTAYEGRLGSDDVICVVAGANSVRALKTAVEDARATYPNNQVWGAGGLRRLDDLPKLPVDLRLVDWEKSTCESVGMEWSWEQSWTLKNYPEQVSILPKPYGMVVSGSPLASRNLQRQGIYWDFSLFNQMGAAFTIVMMQGLVYRSPLYHLLDNLLGNNSFETALAKVVAQFGQLPLDNVGYQVSMGTKQAAAVSPKIAAASVQTAGLLGIHNVFVSGMSVTDNLELIRRLSVV